MQFSLTMLISPAFQNSKYFQDLGYQELSPASIHGNKARPSVKIHIFVLFTFYWMQLSKNSSPKFHECTRDTFVAVPGWVEVIVRLAVGDGCSLCSAHTWYSVDLCSSAATVSLYWSDSQHLYDNLGTYTSGSRWPCACTWLGKLSTVSSFI